MAEFCSVCEKKLSHWTGKHKRRGLTVCGNCEYLVFIKDWKHCPLCGSKADFESKGLGKYYLRCRNCSAEWKVEVKVMGEPEKITLHKPCADGRLTSLVGTSQSFDWWTKADLKGITEETKGG